MAILAGIFVAFCVFVISMEHGQTLFRVLLFLLATTTVLIAIFFATLYTSYYIIAQ